MIGAIIGDIVGSRFEFNNHRSKEFELFDRSCDFTDDTVMTVAVAEALLASAYEGSDLAENTVRCMRDLGNRYPDRGYGGRFEDWLYSTDPKPYGSYGNGAAMRVSPVAYFAKDMAELKRLSAAVTGVTHNHPEGLKGAEATAACVWYALHGKSRGDIKDLASQYYDMSQTLYDIRPTYRFNETCQETVPQAIEAFLESADFEDAIRNAISIGGDSDTLACITGSIAGAYYGVPKWMQVEAYTYLPGRLVKIIKEVQNIWTKRGGAV